MTDQIQKVLDSVRAQIKTLNEEWNEAEALRIKAEQVCDMLSERMTGLQSAESRLVGALDALKRGEGK